VSPQHREAEPPFAVMHVLGSAAPGGAAQVHIVRDLWNLVDPEVFRMDACFVGEHGPLAEELRREGMRVAVAPWRGSHDVAGALRFARVLRAFRPAICHQHVVGGQLPTLVRLLSSSKVVLQLGGSVNEMGDPITWTRATRLAQAVISTSRAAAASAGVSAHVIYPGAPIVESAEPPLLEGEPAISAASRLVPIKGLESLVCAMPMVLEQQPAARLQIAGEGPSRHQLEQLCADLGIAKRVAFMGWQQDLSAVFRTSHLFVAPSLAEGFGIGALEAMAAGLPVIASNVGGLPELVDHGRTGFLVPPNDPQALARCIVQLLSDRELRIRMGRDAQLRVAKRFSPAAMARQISDVYMELVTDSTTNRPR
jgi:glycosyltransferase involved in cell wall biosynthesis